MAIGPVSPKKKKAAAPRSDFFDYATGRAEAETSTMDHASEMQYDAARDGYAYERRSTQTSFRNSNKLYQGLVDSVRGASAYYGGGMGASADLMGQAAAATTYYARRGYASLRKNRKNLRADQASGFRLSKKMYRSQQALVSSQTKVRRDIYEQDLLWAQAEETKAKGGGGGGGGGGGWGGGGGGYGGGGGGGGNNSAGNSWGGGNPLDPWAPLAARNSKARWGVHDSTKKIVASLKTQEVSRLTSMSADYGGKTAFLIALEKEKPRRIQEIVTDAIAYGGNNPYADPAQAANHPALIAIADVQREVRNEHKLNGDGTPKNNDTAWGNNENRLYGKGRGFSPMSGINFANGKLKPMNQRVSRDVRRAAWDLGRDGKHKGWSPAQLVAEVKSPGRGQWLGAKASATSKPKSGGVGSFSLWNILKSEASFMGTANAGTMSNNAGFQQRLSGMRAQAQSAARARYEASHSGDRAADRRYSSFRANLGSDERRRRQDRERASGLAQERINAYNKRRGGGNNIRPRNWR